ncbi:kinase-like domain-containing protein [Aspergillus crustosus]
MESPSTLVKRICSRVNRIRVDNVNSKKFIPAQPLFEVLAEFRDDIERLIRVYENPHDAAEIINVIFTGARKVFTVLLLIDHVPHIRTFINSDQLQHRNFDLVLPYDYHKLRKIMHDDYAAGCFFERQWELCAPAFEGNMIPRRLDRHNIMPYVGELPLAQGGFGSVYRVKFHPSYRPKGFENTEEFVRKEQQTRDITTYDNEVRVLSTLQSLGHPNILRLIACYTYEEKHNLVSPFISGGTLRDYLRKDKPKDLTSEKMFCMMAGLASAIWALHIFIPNGEREPVYKGHHQDLWGDNILVDGNRFILADFGLSSIKKMNEATPTRPKGRKGYYQAPECEDLSAPYQQYKATRASDIFSLGCVFTDLLIFLVFGPKGTKQFRRDRKFTLGPPMIYRVYHKSNQPHEEVQKWLDKVLREDPRESTTELVRLVEKMLELAPDKRPRADEITAIVYVCAIKAFSEKINACFAQFEEFQDAAVEKARFSSWTLTQEPIAYIKSSGATAVEKEFTAVVAILSKMVETLKSIGHNQQALSRRSFYEIRPLNLQLFDMLSRTRREMAEGNVRSMLLERFGHDKPNMERDIAQSDIGYQDIISKATTKQLVARVENHHLALLQSSNSRFNTIAESSFERRRVEDFDLGIIRYQNPARTVSVLMQTIEYHDPMTWHDQEPRIDALYDLLSSEDVKTNFRIPPFHGVCKRQNDWAFDLVYEYPRHAGGQAPNQEPVSLHSLLVQRDPRHGTLENRFNLAASLADMLAGFHDVDWFHKELNPFNVVFFPHTGGLPSDRLSQPYLVGFQHSRRSTEDSTDGLSQDLIRQRYYHPSYLSTKSEQSAKVRPSFDRYNLGVLLLEIGLWSPIGSIMGGHEHEDRAAFLDSIKDKKLTDLAFAMGTRYAGIVNQCLTELDDEVDPTGYTGSFEPSSNVFFRQAVVIPLQALASHHVQLETRSNKRKRSEDGDSVTRSVKHGKVSTLPTRSS